MNQLCLATGGIIRLGGELARAGEGTISDVVGHPEWVAKIYHANLEGLDVRGNKVRAMASAKPAGRVQSNGFVVLAWPEHAVVGPDNKACGFVMRKIDTATAVEIHALSNPSDRKSPHPAGPQWPKNVTWDHLLHIAINLCRAVTTVHRANAVIGDFNERNILVSHTAQVTFVDCDSFQFQSGTKVYHCTVGRPEFLAPELARVPLETHKRSEASDLFVLAIHLYILLMEGNHPFSRGDWKGPGDPPDALALAAEGHWAGGRNSKLSIHRAAPAIDVLPPAVRNLFERALGEGAKNPARRPTADEWRNALTAVRTVQCPQDKMHQYPAHNRSCPWCQMKKKQQSSGQAGQGRTITGTSPFTMTGTQNTRPSTYASPRLKAPTPPPRPASNTPTRPPGGAATTLPGGPASPPKRGHNRKSRAFPILSILLIVVVIWIIIGINSDTDSSGASTPATEVPAATPEIGMDILPSNAQPCPRVYAEAEFPNSAKGNNVTSCEFAENVRAAYLAQGIRNAPVAVRAYSPITYLNYDMFCRGNNVITCTGGKDALVYIY
ncbi:hypothetical protein Rruber_05546 (plasmid) [Rhodococcus ruber]|uniref:protein kinase domain-containing protein n=1 Tax=Rhodococcus ruber TaxID=1830 RepID=UPI003365E853